MQATEAAQVIDEMIKSLRANPGQFNINVRVVTAGAVGIGGSGGPGIVGIAQGGGVGVSASAGAPSQMTVEIARQQGQRELSAQLGQMLTTLEEIRNELLQPKPSKSRIQNFLDSLSSKWLPEAIISVVTKLITSSIGGL